MSLGRHFQHRHHFSNITSCFCKPSFKHQILYFDLTIKPCIKTPLLRTIFSKFPKSIVRNNRLRYPFIPARFVRWIFSKTTISYPYILCRKNLINMLKNFFMGVPIVSIANNNNIRIINRNTYINLMKCKPNIGSFPTTNIIFMKTNFVLNAQ